MTCCFTVSILVWLPPTLSLVKLNTPLLRFEDSGCCLILMRVGKHSSIS